MYKIEIYKIAEEDGPLTWVVASTHSNLEDALAQEELFLARGAAPENIRIVE